MFPIVGLGASAGGLEALTEFFANTPPDSGVAFVVVTHQHPDRTSLMPDLLSRHTDMPVAEAASGMRVEPDHVYVSPPGSNLAILHGALALMEPDPATKQLPIDYFFRSLARDQGARAIGIVLSGTGTDGTIGLKEIKGVSGMVMVQDEASARYAGMPHSAIATTLADYVLPASELPQQLVAYSTGIRHLLKRVERAELEPSEPMRQVFILLRSRTGHDFSGYKQTTIHRRIERRMNVHHIDELTNYVRYLQANPNELDLLFKELLIGVTSFFRDPEAFEALAAEALPALLADKPEGHVVRVWVPGCSTGDEAYSLAILIRECAERLVKPLDVQIFATDLDSKAVDVARAGVYPGGIAVDVTPERLARFFVREEGAFRIKKEIREMVVFAPQNLIDDPPFTKLDLLSCRNVLIYLKPEVQAKLLPIFHYALKPNGILFLGSSESIGGFSHLFDTVDKKSKIFRRKEVAPGTYVADFPGAERLTVEVGKVPPMVNTGARLKAPGPNLGRLADEVLLRQLVPASLMVHERGDIVHVHGRTGLYFEMSPGIQDTNNIFNMAREGLELQLASAMRQAASGTPVVRRAVRVKTNGDSILVDLRVQRLTEPEAFRGLFVVAFENPRLPAADQEVAEQPADDDVDLVAELRRELQYSKESHQSTLEEMETTNEELKSTNEELQSTNEELQSANEELETSKEEMQSLNEELQTVNVELQEKIDELSRANDDMKNLLDGTDIATVFLDPQLRIKRYTEPATRVISLIPSDIGRPLSDQAYKLEYENLIEDAEEVLRTFIPKEAEVAGQDNRWFLMRILPYRTTENTIDGLVMTFVDITETKNAVRFAEAVVETAPTPLLVLDRDLRVVSANRAFCEIFESKEDQLKGQRIFEIDRGEWNIDGLHRLLEGTLSDAPGSAEIEITHEIEGVGPVLVSARPLRFGQTPALGHVLLAFHVGAAKGDG